MANEDIHEVVEARYGQAVKAAVNGTKTSCCGEDVEARLSALDGAAFLRSKKPEASA